MRRPLVALAALTGLTAALQPLQHTSRRSAVADEHALVCREALEAQLAQAEDN